MCRLREAIIINHMVKLGTISQQEGGEESIMEKIIIFLNQMFEFYIRKRLSIT